MVRSNNNTTRKCFRRKTKYFGKTKLRSGTNSDGRRTQKTKMYNHTQCPGCNTKGNVSIKNNVGTSSYFVCNRCNLTGFTPYNSLMDNYDVIADLNEALRFREWDRSEWTYSDLRDLLRRCPKLVEDFPERFAILTL